MWKKRRPVCHPLVKKNVAREREEKSASVGIEAWRNEVCVEERKTEKILLKWRGVKCNEEKYREEERAFAAKKSYVKEKKENISEKSFEEAESTKKQSYNGGISRNSLYLLLHVPRRKLSCSERKQASKKAWRPAQLKASERKRPGENMKLWPAHAVRRRKPGGIWKL